MTIEQEAAIRAQLAELTDENRAEGDLTLRDALLGAVKMLPSDFEPFGERKQQGSKPWDGWCSLGCAHFAALGRGLGWLGQGLGPEWGVCANPASPRFGLLTFHQQGCPQYEHEPTPPDLRPGEWVAWEAEGTVDHIPGPDAEGVRVRAQGQPIWVSRWQCRRLEAPLHARVVLPAREGHKDEG